MTFLNNELTENDIKEIICNIDSMISEFDFHGSYDIFAQKEIDELIKSRNHLKSKLRGIQNDDN